MTLTATRAAALNRTSPFLAHSLASDRSMLLLDRFELPLGGVPAEIWAKIDTSVDLRPFGPLVQPSTMIALMSEQFAAAGEFVYGHPLWEAIRHGDRSALHAYMLETRHYLSAASARMSPSVVRHIGLSPLNLLLSQHLIEEWDHAKFYSAALAAIGCSRDLVAASRPMPATIEWIHATRHIGYVSGLNAAMCSGFMEHSSTEIDAVNGWHDMLVSEGLLPAGANTALVGHVDTDVAFGHVDNWKHALTEHGPLRTAEAASALNAVATLAEAIYRWLSSLHQGLAGSVVKGVQLLTETSTDTSSDMVDPGLDTGGAATDSAERAAVADADDRDMNVAIYDGLPVWPAGLMRTVSWGDPTLTPAARVVTGLTYALGADDDPLPRVPLSSLVRDNAARLASASDSTDSVAALDHEASTWLRSIDGHELWTAMTDEPSDALITGYVLENYHYLASAAGHVGAAIASCTSGAVRAKLIAHLEDELTHCYMLERKLIEIAGVECPSSTRPLPTTVAFVGFLQNLAHQDWKAYLVVSTYLQRSLSETRDNGRGSGFYAEVAKRSRIGAELLAALRDHDEIDEGLGHDDRPTERLADLLALGPVSADSVRHAAVAPALAWGFLDGIVQHYRHGPEAVRQRRAWIG